jgi:hypothetical protein
MLSGLTCPQQYPQCILFFDVESISTLPDKGEESLETSTRRDETKTE